jgi:phage regulator Rha-like protein
VGKLLFIDGVQSTNFIKIAGCLATFITFAFQVLPLLCALGYVRGETQVKPSSMIPIERIEKAIYLIRGERVMLDRDLAELYGIPTKVFNQTVKRHTDRFPADFMYQLTKEEAEGVFSRSQSVTLKRGQNIKYRPYAFTEHGILMLSSVLNSERAIQVNIEIMRTFVELRRMLASNAELSQRFDELENKYDRQFKVVFDAIRQLMSPPLSGGKQIGFRSRPVKK